MYQNAIMVVVVEQLKKILIAKNFLGILVLFLSNKNIVTWKGNSLEIKIELFCLMF